MFTIIVSSFISFLLMLLPIANPVGMAPNFLFYTESMSDEFRRKLAKKVFYVSLIFSLGILIFGPFLLRFFGVSVQFVKISGGLLLVISGWQILSKNASETPLSSQELGSIVDGNFFFPLVFPITIGSGSIAIILAVASGYISDGINLFNTVGSYIGACCALLVNSLLFYLCYAKSKEIFSKIGKMGTVVLCKISGLILMAIGFQIAWNGFSEVIVELFKTLKAANLL